MTDGMARRWVCQPHCRLEFFATCFRRAGRRRSQRLVVGRHNFNMPNSERLRQVE